MPVPVIPEKSVSAEVIQSNSQASPSVSAEGSSSSSDPCVVAGYEDCLRETIRFLVQEEKLPEEHPLVSGLNLHLATDTAHKELMRVSNELAKKLSDELRASLEEETEEREADSGMESSFSDEEELPYAPPTQAYKITLQECDDEIEEDEIETTDEDYCMEEDYSDDEGAEDIITAKDILSHPFLRNELIKMVFQGCDLVASPNVTAEPHNGLQLGSFVGTSSRHQSKASSNASSEAPL